MANDENLKGYGFHEPRTKEQREIAVMGGQTSGEARRRKANFRKTLNQLLTTEIDNPEWKPVLESLGIECTLESALNMTMIKRRTCRKCKSLRGDCKVCGAKSKKPK